MKIRLVTFCVLTFFLLIIACKMKQENPKPVFNPNPTPAYLSPEESLRTMYLPDGYHVELVASEPMIQEPVAITWDANGRMYVAEMITYMQDADATGEQLPYSKIMLLEDTDNDGKMDKSSVFVDSLLLPRMMQCVGNELLVNETNSITITSYSDSNGDGKADIKKVVYKDDTYTANDANMEHQRSGLDWNLDNWMYTTYEPARFRYTNGVMKIDSIAAGGSGQWGLTHDNYGRLFYSSAGGEVPVLGFQINPMYGKLDFPDQFAPEFQEVWSIIATPDVQGGDKRLRPNTTLNHFTGCCGQSIFRGNNLPADMVGDYFVCEPVGRIVRRAKVTEQDGKTLLKNAYEKEEFIASSDMNFRPVNSATGPDGNLYIVDMYRGIIQQANWTKPGSFIRKKIDSLGLAKNIGRGRIYRVVHDDFKKGPGPKMLNEPAGTLVTYLGHPNGWWRDNAQKLLVIRGDLSVVPALKAIATGQKEIASSDTGHLARIHALWTLEGLDAIDKEVLFAALKDGNAQVRKTAVWIGEAWLKKNDTAMLKAISGLEQDPSYDVRVQVLLSMNNSNSDAAKAIVKDIVAKNTSNEMLAATRDALDKTELVRMLAARLGKMPEADKKTILGGAVIYRSLCASCHGADGKGIQAGGLAMPAPPLAGAATLNANEKNTAIRILLNGLSGQTGGKTYPGEMPSMGANSNGWIASVLSYTRYEFGSRPGGKKMPAPVVTSDEVKTIRMENPDRNKPWTIEELKRVK